MRGTKIKVDWDSWQQPDHDRLTFYVHWKAADFFFKSDTPPASNLDLPHHVRITVPLASCHELHGDGFSIGIYWSHTPCSICRTWIWPLLVSTSCGWNPPNLTPPCVQPACLVFCHGSSLVSLQFTHWDWSPVLKYSNISPSCCLVTISAGCSQHRELSLPGYSCPSYALMPDPIRPWATCSRSGPWTIHIRITGDAYYILMPRLAPPPQTVLR